MEAILNICNEFDLTGYIPCVVFVQFPLWGVCVEREKNLRAKRQIQCIEECFPWSNCLGCTKAERTYFWGFCKNPTLIADPFKQPSYKKELLHHSRITSSPLAEVTGKGSMRKVKPEKSDIYSQEAEELHFTYILKALRNVNYKSITDSERNTSGLPLAPRSRQTRAQCSRSKKRTAAKLTPLELAAGCSVIVNPACCVSCCNLAKSSHLVLHASAPLAPLKTECGSKHQRSKCSSSQPESQSWRSPHAQVSRNSAGWQRACRLYERLHRRRKTQWIPSLPAPQPNQRTQRKPISSTVGRY